MLASSHSNRLNPHPHPPSRRFTVPAFDLHYRGDPLWVFCMYRVSPCPVSPFKTPAPEIGLGWAKGRTRNLCVTIFIVLTAAVQSLKIQSTSSFERLSLLVAGVDV